jgi:glycerophosphoryl diester phosphodiesterase
MKLEFLTKTLIANKGVYNNKNVMENTLDAFEKAINLNVGILFNIWQTKDKKIIVFDEADLSKLLNLKDKIEDTTYDELCFLSPFHIPLLKEVLTLIKGKIPIIINPKSDDKHHEFIKNMLNMLDGYDGDFALINENPCIIKLINSLRPTFNVGEEITKSNHHSLSRWIANYSIKTNFKFYDIKYYDELKVNALRKECPVIGYYILRKQELVTYKESFDNLIINNYEDIVISE